MTRPAPPRLRATAACVGCHGTAVASDKRHTRRLRVLAATEAGAPAVHDRNLNRALRGHLSSEGHRRLHRQRAYACEQAHSVAEEVDFAPRALGSPGCYVVRQLAVTHRMHRLALLFVPERARRRSNATTSCSSAPALTVLPTAAYLKCIRGQPFIAQPHSRGRGLESLQCDAKGVEVNCNQLAHLSCLAYSSCGAMLCTP